MIKSLVVVFELYILVMGVLAIFLTTPMVWSASSSVYFGVVYVAGLWFTIFTFVIVSLLATHESGKPRKKHDV